MFHSQQARQVYFVGCTYLYIYIYRERAFSFLFFFPSDDAVPILELRVARGIAKALFRSHSHATSAVPRARFSGRGKFRPTSSSQPLYSTVLQLVFERNSAADRGRHKVFSVRHLEWYRESFVNGGEIDFMRIIGYDRWRMMRKICKPLFHLSRFRGFVIVYWNVGK